MTPIITWSIVALIVGAVLAMRIYWAAHFNRVLRAQEVRDNFARSRRGAIQLVHDKQLQPDSLSFAILYLVSSKLVRRSNSYGAFSSVFITSLGNSELRSDSPALDVLQKEMESWTPDVREAWDVFAGNIYYMVGTSVWWMRAFVWWDRFLPVSQSIRVFTRALERVAKGPDGNGTLRIGIDVMKTSRRTQEWAREARATA